jgi:predicted esterase
VPLDRGVEIDLGRLAGVPVLFQVGVHDTVIPIEALRASASALGSCGADLTARDYDAGHEVTIEMLADTRAWLASPGERTA